MDKYRERGLKLTPQRIAIFDFLEGNKDHPSADDIYRAVSKRFPTMSFATVYNTLSALRDRGSIRELSVDPGKKRYDPDTNEHNHLICTGCRKVIDVHQTYDLDMSAVHKNDFTITTSQIEFYGLCADCRTARNTKPAR